MMKYVIKVKSKGGLNTMKNILYNDGKGGELTWKSQQKD